MHVDSGLERTIDQRGFDSIRPAGNQQKVECMLFDQAGATGLICNRGVTRLDALCLFEQASLRG